MSLSEYTSIAITILLISMGIGDDFWASFELFAKGMESFDGGSGIGLDEGADRDIRGLWWNSDIIQKHDIRVGSDRRKICIQDFLFCWTKVGTHSQASNLCGIWNGL